MTEKIKNGLCAVVLLLAVLLAYAQEISFRQGTAVQPAPFAAEQIK